MAPKKKPATTADENATTTIRVFRSDQRRIKIYAAVNNVDMQEVVRLGQDLLEKASRFKGGA